MGSRADHGWRVALALFAGLVVGAHAQTVTRPAHGLALIRSGRVDLRDANGVERSVEASSDAKTPQTVPVRAGEIIRTAKDGICDVMLPSVGTVRLTSDTEVQMPAKPAAGTRPPGHSMELLKGKLFMDVDAAQLKRNQNQEFRLKTPTTILAIRGTRLFVESRDGTDTAGVHQGLIAVTETASGKTASVPAGSAVSATAGSLAKPRPLTADELAGSGGYETFALSSQLAEGLTRKADVQYRCNIDPKTAIKEPLKGFANLERFDATNGLGPILHVRFKPNTKYPDRPTVVSLQVDLPKRVRGEPVAVQFFLRGEGVSLVNCQVHAGDYRKTEYGNAQGIARLGEAGSTGAWVPVAIPVYADPGQIQDSAAYDHKQPVLILSIDPGLTPKITSAEFASVSGDRNEYVIEVSPVYLVTRAVD